MIKYKVGISVEMNTIKQVVISDSFNLGLQKCLSKIAEKKTDKFAIRLPFQYHQWCQKKGKAIIITICC